MEDPNIELFDQILTIKDKDAITNLIKKEPSLLYCTRDEFGQTLLHHACDIDSRNSALVEGLVENGAKIDGEDGSGSTPFHYACRTNPDANSEEDLKIVRILIENAEKQGISILSLKNKKRQLPVHFAAQCPMSESNTKIIDLLLSHKSKFDINAQDIRLSKKRQEQEFSLQYNSLIPIRDEEFMRPTRPPHNFNFDNYTGDVTPELISEASHNHHNHNHNHNHNHDSNSLSASVVIGYTALHYCVFFANSDGVKLLLENGANANIKDESDGLIPIFTSLQKELSTLHDLTLRPDFCHKMRTITSLLIPHTDMSVTDKEGDTVLHLLANNNVPFELTDKINQEEHKQILEERQEGLSKALAKLIIDKSTNKIDINKKNLKGRSPLQVASSNGNIPLTKLLLSYSANVEIEDEFGFRAIHEACSFGHLEIVKCLVRNGAEVSCKTNSFPNNTPLHIAATNGHLDIVQFLLTYGNAPILIQDAEGNTAESVASSFQIKELLSSFVQIKLVHEQTLVISKEASNESLLNTFSQFQSQYGNNLQVEVSTDSGHFNSFNGSEITQKLQEISTVLHKIEGEEPFILVTHPSSYQGKSIKVKINESNNYIRLIINPATKFSDLKAKIITKLQLLKSETLSEIKEVLLLPDILIVDDEDVFYIPHNAQLKVTFV